MIRSLSHIKSSISQNFINIPGAHLKRKIVVIESDDWGSIRMPSMEVYNNFLNKGFDLTNSDYNRIDSLESNVDLTRLFELLTKFKDSNNNSPVITANTVVGNPDFKKIAESDFKEYFVEPVSSTLLRYEGRDKVMSLWKEGYEKGIYHPQFHGREHVNIVRWMEALRKRSPEIMYTFENETTFSGDGDYNFMEVLDYNTPEDLVKMKESLAEGLDLFENIFGYRSKSFIPPCYTWNSDIEETLSAGGVRYIQGLVVQLIPTGNFGSYKKKYHFLGQKNSFGQHFLIRNAFFEPSLTKGTDTVGQCLKRIDIAFRWNKPAIISAHRINFIGALDEKNRENNLKLFENLLKRIIKRWPEVEFMSSDELGDLISGEGGSE